MRKITWLGGSSEKAVERFAVNNILFELDHQDYKKKTTKELVLLCKTSRLLKSYIEIFSKHRCSKILEFGIFEGGSALFCASLLDNLEKIVSVDLRPFNPVVDKIIRQNNMQEQVKLYYGMRQDSPDIKKIAREEFAGQIDIIIDDCSHSYGPTKASFEMMFPLLSPGGLYIIEDWAWAHWPGYQSKGSTFSNEPALTNLIFELISLRGTHQEWFQDITIKNVSMVVIQKGNAAIAEPMDIAGSTLMRGKRLQPI